MTLERHHLLGDESIAHGGEQGLRQHGRQSQAQSLARQARQLRVVGVEGGEERHDRPAKLGPAIDRVDDCVRTDPQVAEAQRRDQRFGEGCGEAAVGREAGEVLEAWLGGEQPRERFGGIGRRQRFEPGQALRRAPLARRGTGVDDAAAADRALGALVAQDEEVAVAQRQRMVEHDLRERVLAGWQGVGGKHHHPGADVAGAAMEMHGRPLAERSALAGEQPDAGVEARRLVGGTADPGAARHDLLGHARAGEGEGAPFARPACGGLVALRVQRAHPGLGAPGKDRNLVADVDATGEHGAGDDRSHAVEREGAVDRHAEHVALVVRGPHCRGGDQARAQGVEPFPRARGHEQDVGALERGADQDGVDLPQHRHAPVRVQAVALADDDDAPPQSEQAEDPQVFAGLRHHPVVAGDDEEGEVDAGRSRDHRAHELLVPRHVDEADRSAAFVRHVGEAEVDGDAARLLLLEAIGVDTREGADQRRLAVIDVTGGSDDHAATVPAAPSAARPSVSPANSRLTRSSRAATVSAGSAPRTLGRKRAASKLPRRVARARWW